MSSGVDGFVVSHSLDFFIDGWASRPGIATIARLCILKSLFLVEELLNGGLGDLNKVCKHLVGLLKCNIFRVN